MKNYTILDRNRYFEVLGDLNSENRGDNKVAMLAELDMSSAEAIRIAVKEQCGIKPSYTAIVAKAVSLALREHPYANRIAVEFPFWRRILQLHDVHLTVAVERDKGSVEQAVFAGTIRNTDTLDLAAITRELLALAQATEENNQRWRTVKRLVETIPPFLARWIFSCPRWIPSLWVEHRGGAVMISSPAKYGVDIMVGNWPWPVGFSFGLVKDRPIVVNGEVVARPTMVLTMSFDRRLMGGAPAARFFRTVCDRVEHAEHDLAFNQIQSERPPLKNATLEANCVSKNFTQTFFHLAHNADR